VQRLPGFLRVIHGRVQGFAHAFARARHGAHDRNVHEAGQTLRIDAHALGFQGVDHVQGHGHGNADLKELHRQVQVAFQAGGVEDVDDALGAFVDQEVAGHKFFLGIGGQGIGAGQVHHAGQALRGFDISFLLLHGDARIIADMLP
jgi:hypothetical protein